MLKVNILASGSEGNATIIDNGKTVLAIDMGITSKDWVFRAKDKGYDYIDLNGVLITHAHGDHVNTSLNKFIQVMGNDMIYTTPAVSDDIQRKFARSVTRFISEDTKSLSLNGTTRIGTFLIKPIKMEHYGYKSSAITQCIGFDILDEENNKRYLYASDTRTLDNVIVPDGGFDILMIEDNHCAEHLQKLYDNEAIDPIKFMRSKDHMSTQETAKWLFKNQHNAEVILLHESRGNKPEHTVWNKTPTGEFYKTYRW